MVKSNESSYRNPRGVQNFSSSFEKNNPVKGNTWVSQTSVAVRKNDQWNVRQDIPVGTVRNSPFSPEPKQQPPPSPQLKHQKMQWDTSDIPKGSVAARIQQSNSPSSKSFRNKPVSPSLNGGGNGRPKSFSYGSPGYNHSYSTESPRSNSGARREISPKVGTSSSQMKQSTSVKPSDQTSPQTHVEPEQEKVVPKKGWEPSREIPTGMVQGRLSALFGGQKASTVTKAKDMSTHLNTNSNKVGYGKPLGAKPLKQSENPNDDDGQWIIPERKGETIQVSESDWGEAIPVRSAESDDWETPAKDWIRSSESQLTEASSCQEVEQKPSEEQYSQPTEIAASMPDEMIPQTLDGDDRLQRNGHKAKPSASPMLAPPPNDASAYHKVESQNLKEDPFFDQKSSLSQGFSDNFEIFSSKSENDSIDKSKAQFSSSTDAINQQLINGHSDPFGFPLSFTPEVVENQDFGEVVGGDEFFDASTQPDDHDHSPSKSQTSDVPKEFEKYDSVFDEPPIHEELNQTTAADKEINVSMESKVQEHVLNGQEVLASSQNREYSGTTHNEQGNDEIMPKSDDRPTKNKSGFNLDGYHSVPSATSYDDIAQSGTNDLKSGRRDSKKKKKGFFKGLFGRKSKGKEKVKQSAIKSKTQEKSFNSTPNISSSVTISHDKNANETILLHLNERNSGSDEIQVSGMTEKNPVNEFVDALEENESEAVTTTNAARNNVSLELKDDSPSSQELKTETVEDVFLDPELDHVDSNTISDEESNGTPADLPKIHSRDGLALDTLVENSFVSDPTPTEAPKQDCSDEIVAMSSKPIFAQPSAVEATVRSQVATGSRNNSSLADKYAEKEYTEGSVEWRGGRRLQEGAYGRRNRLARNGLDSQSARKDMAKSKIHSSNEAGSSKKFSRATYAYNSITKKSVSEDTEDQRKYLSIPAVSTSASDISYTSSTYDSYQKKLSESLKKANIVAKNSADFSLQSKSLDDSSIESDIRVLRTVLRRPRLDYNNDKVIQASRQNQDFPTYDAESVTDPMQRLGMRLLSSAIIPIQTEVRRFLATRHAMTRMWALIMIQTYTRRFLARKKFRKAVSSVITIQSVVRGHLGRNEVIDKHICAIEIQRHVRGYLATMQVYEDIYKVTLVQSLVRMRIAMDYAAYRMSLIIQVQAIARGFLERRRHAHRNRCATLIQSGWRCFYNRMNYQFDLLDIIIVQSLWRKKMALRVAETKMMEKRNKAATVVQAAWRAYDCRMDYLYYTSARTIQAKWRMQLCRYDYLEYKAATKIQSAVRAFLCRSDYTNYKAEIAATVIQSKWRSYDCQMNYLHFLSDILTVQSTIRRFLVQRKMKAMKDNAAAGFQSAWRRYVCRKHYEREKAAILIQSTWRGFLIYADYMFELSDIVVVQKQMRCWLAKRAADRRRQEIKDTAAASIQKHWRRITDQKRYEIIKREARACTVIQKNWRRFWCFSNFVIALDCSIQIQAQARGYIQRKKCASQKLAVSVIEDTWRDTQAKRMASQLSVIDEIAVTSREVVMKESNAAIKLQQVFRGSLCRNALKAYLAAVLIQSHVRGNQARVAVSLYIAVRKIQAAWRGFAPRQSYKTYVAVRKIQAAWRGFIPRQCFRTFVAARRIQNSWRCKKAKEEALMLRKECGAAILIQSAWRGFVCYTDYVFTMSDILTVQRLARGYLARKKYSGIVRSKISKMKVTFNGAAALQKIFRGYQARQNYWYALGCTMQIQNWWRGQLVKLRMQREAKAICTLQCFARCCLARQEYMQRRFVFMLIQTAELERSKKAKGLKMKEQRRGDSEHLRKDEFSDVDHEQASQLMLATKRRREWREKMKKEKDADDVDEHMLENVWSVVVANSDLAEEPFTRHYDDFSKLTGPVMPLSSHPTSSIRMPRKTDAIDLNDDFQLEEAFIDAEIFHAKERRSFAGNGRSKRSYPPLASSRSNTKSTIGGRRVVSSVAGKKKRTASIGREKNRPRGNVLSMSNY